MFPEKFRTISGGRLRRRTRGNKGDLLCEVGGPGIPRQYRTALRIAFRDYVQWRIFTNSSKNPFGIVGSRQASWPICLISQCQAHQLDWSVCWYEYQEVLMEITTVMRVACVSLTMENGHRCPWS